MTKNQNTIVSKEIETKKAKVANKTIIENKNMKSTVAEKTIKDIDLKVNDKVVKVEEVKNEEKAAKKETKTNTKSNRAKKSATKTTKSTEAKKRTTARPKATAKVKATSDIEKKVEVAEEIIIPNNIAEILGDAQVKLIPITGVKKEAKYPIYVVLQDLGFEKEVVVHYTVDNWKTFLDKPLEFLSKEGDLEVWNTDIKISSRNKDKFKYVIKYTVNEYTNWDNNETNDYSF